MNPFRLLRRLPFKPKFAIRNSKLLVVLLSLSPLLLSSPSAIHAQWEPDVRLTYDQNWSYSSYNNAWCIAANKDSVYVVWYDHRNGNWEIYYNRSTDGGATWEGDRRLTNADTTSWHPSIAVSGSNVHLIWEDCRDLNYVIYYKRSTDGGTTWGPDTRLTNTPDYSQDPSLAVSGSNVHLVWDDWRDRNLEIYYKRSTDSGASWSADCRLSYNSATSWYPSVAVSGSTVHVVWDDYRYDNDEIFYKRSTDGGATWGPETRLTYAPYESRFPSIAVSDSNVHVFWHDYRDWNYEIYYKRSTDRGTTWENDIRLTNHPSNSGFPSAAVSNSNVHVVWWDDRYEPSEWWEIYYKRSTDNGLTWESDARLTYGENKSWYSSLAISGSSVHLVWTDWRDGNPEIYYKRNPTGNSGVEDVQPLRLPPYASRLTIFPNPFTSLATLPGHEAERFVLYDISGRRVGVWKGDRVGLGLPAGVYFLKSEGKDTKPLRIVKLR